ncbi:MAG: YigZ family protein [Melioribacteraceae bacterium]|nr:YigZ family protein [Melioribacteraceae bacterium]
MTKEEIIKVIAAEYSNKLKVKGSIFLGKSYKVRTSSDAENILSRIRKEYYDATHHCYAYKLNEGSEKYSDDGEPNGTAGIRILNAIESYSLTDILVVVIRYFGGTKLGVGPLGKAYGDTASDLLDSAEKWELKRYEKIRIDYEYDQTNPVHFLLNKFDCRQIESGYDENPYITALITPDKLAIFPNELTEKTAGNAHFISLKEEVYLRLK